MRLLVQQAGQVGVVYIDNENPVRNEARGRGCEDPEVVEGEVSSAEKDQGAQVSNHAVLQLPLQGRRQTR